MGVGTTGERTSLVWYRSDLRTIDCRPLLKACDGDGVVHACVLLCVEQWKNHGWGDDRIEYFRRSLQNLSCRLSELHIPLHIREAKTFCDAPGVITRLVQELGIHEVHWGYEYEVNEQKRDKEVSESLTSVGVGVHQHHDQVLLNPHSPRTGQGGAFKVFTPYKKALLRIIEENNYFDAPSVRPEPRSQSMVDSDPIPESFDGVNSTVDLSPFPIGEEAALQALSSFLETRGPSYDSDRDIPSIDGTSMLAAALAVGSISPRMCMLAAHARQADLGGSGGLDTWMSEVIWREFYRHVLFNHPHVCRGHNFDRSKDSLVWRDDPESFSAWKTGQTGIPIVDAAMRCLVATGWMHNRLRMVTAQFLSKNLLLDWRLGESFFAKSLVDYDFASNNGGWQWSSSTGTDSAPYFRVFNPVRQGERFDPEGAFTLRWIPELAEIPVRQLHQPWVKHADICERIGYPSPIVDLSASRARAIEAFKVLS